MKNNKQFHLTLYILLFMVSMQRHQTFWLEFFPLCVDHICILLSNLCNVRKTTKKSYLIFLMRVLHRISVTFNAFKAALYNMKEGKFQKKILWHSLNNKFRVADNMENIFPLHILTRLTVYKQSIRIGSNVDWAGLMLIAWKITISNFLN